MADGVGKGQLSLNKFFDPSTPSVKKANSGEENRLMRIVATTSLPAVDRPNADRWNAAHLRQNNDIYSGH